jgi:hypothetical protein
MSYRISIIDMFVIEYEDKPLLVVGKIHIVSKPMINGWLPRNAGQSPAVDHWFIQFCYHVLMM